MTGNYITPVLRNTSFSYCYEKKGREPEQIWINNNLEEVRLLGQEFRENKAHHVLFKTLEQNEKVLYLGFQLPPVGAPLRMLWQMENRLFGTGGSLSFEYSGKDGWKELNLADETRNFTRTGLLTFIGQQDFSKLSLFGKTMYWLRVQDESGFYSGRQEQKQYPVLKKLWMNAAEVMHMDREETEVFTLDVYQTDCKFTLMQGNIDEIEVAVLKENTQKKE